MPDYVVHAHIKLLVCNAAGAEDARKAALRAVNESDEMAQSIGTCNDVFIDELESFIETDKGSAYEWGEET